MAKKENKDVIEKENENEKTEIKEEIMPEEIKPIRTQPREILANEYIQVRSVTEGGLTYIDPRTKMKYLWSEYGSVQSMTFDVLLSMRASSPTFLTTPYVVIDDKDVVEKLHIGYIYDDFDFEIANDLERFFETSISDMRMRIRKLPECIKDNLKIKARALYKEKKLADLNRIKMLEEELNIDLTILSDDYR